AARQMRLPSGRVSGLALDHQSAGIARCTPTCLAPPRASGAASVAESAPKSRGSGDFRPDEYPGGRRLGAVFAGETGPREKSPVICCAQTANGMHAASRSFFMRLLSYA